MSEVIQKHLLKGSNQEDETTQGELLAYCEGFLMGMARRIEQSYSSSSNPQAILMADDCRALADRIGIIRGHPPQKAPA